MVALVADDDPKIREALATTLRDLAGFENIIQVASGPEAYAVAAMSVTNGTQDVLRLDMIVLDRSMPGGDGISALRLMRNLGVTAPVVVVTAEASETARREALDAGADGYLCKPFAGEALATEVGRVLAKREAACGRDGDPERAGEAGD